MCLESTKRKLIDAAVLAIATLTVIGTHVTQTWRIDAIEAVVDEITEWRADNAKWRNNAQNALDSISKSLDVSDPQEVIRSRDVLQAVDNAKKEILQQIETKQVHNVDELKQ